jgi:hypothetical protein
MCLNVEDAYFCLQHFQTRKYHTASKQYSVLLSIKCLWVWNKKQYISQIPNRRRLILNCWKEKSKFVGGHVTVSLFRTVHRPTFRSLQVLQYTAWILGLFNSAFFRTHISKDWQMANSKLQRKYGGKQLWLILSFHPRIFLYEPVRATQPWG